MKKYFQNTKSFIKNIGQKFKYYSKKLSNLDFTSEEEIKKELEIATENALKTYEKYDKFKNSSENKHGVERKTTKSNQVSITVFTDNGPVTMVPGIEFFSFNTNEYSQARTYEGIFDDKLYYNVELTKCADIYYNENHNPTKVLVNGFTVNPETKEVKFISEQKQGSYHHLSAQFKIYVHQYADRQRINEINEKIN